MKRVAIIVQRYGAEVNGGAEVHARMIAKQLSNKYEITVVTSCAKEYQTWEPFYTPGETNEDGIRVLRFLNNERGSRSELKYARRKASGRLPIQKIYKLLGRPPLLEKLLPVVRIEKSDHERWLKAQGPYIPELEEYLKTNERQYDAFVFFTALYYPTAAGVQVVGQKSILVPTMHDEKPIYMPGYRDVMTAPRWIFFNTEAEQEFSEKLFPIAEQKKRVVGVGIDLLKGRPLNKATLPEVLQKGDPYIVYIGRVDANKGCDVLISYFERFLKETTVHLRLVMVGKVMLEKKSTESIIYTGFVDDNTKEEILINSEALVIPSFFESLSLVLLESMGAGKPVIANGNTEVLRDHINKSGGGWNYFSYADFKAALLELVTEKSKTHEMGERGYQYVKEHYAWEKVMSDYDKAIEEIGTI